MANPKLTAEEAFALATRYAQQGKITESRALCFSLLRLLPKDAPFHADLVALLASIDAIDIPNAEKQHLRRLLDQNDYQEALRAAKSLLPRYPKDPFLLGFLGTVFYETGRPKKSREMLLQAVALAPDRPGLHIKLGLTLKQLQAFGEALQSFEKALSIKPEYWIALTNKALVLADLGRLNHALATIESAVNIAPDQPGVWSGKGIILDKIGRQDEALRCFDKALKEEPSNLRARQGKAHILLAQGNYAEGWKEFEWRWRRSDVKRPTAHASAPWRGEPLHGKTLLVLAEQGLGDQIQFARYAETLADQGAVVVLECHPKLETLLRSCPGVKKTVAKGQRLPEADYHCPAMSIPAILGHAHLPDARPAYLCPSAPRSEEWRDLLNGLQGLRIGIHWQGNPKYHADKWRSFPLDHFGVLAKCPNVSLVSLQKGEAAQLNAFRSNHALTDLDTLAGRDTDMDDAAAAITHLDLVVSNCTSIAHLSAALGKPTWIVLAHSADWRWMHDRSDSPWYPTVRLFRQTTPGDWSPVFETVADVLRRFVSEKNEEI